MKKQKLIIFFVCLFMFASMVTGFSLIYYQPYNPTLETKASAAALSTSNGPFVCYGLYSDSKEFSSNIQLGYLSKGWVLWRYNSLNISEDIINSDGQDFYHGFTYSQGTIIPPTGGALSNGYSKGTISTKKGYRFESVKLYSNSSSYISENNLVNQGVEQVPSGDNKYCSFSPSGADFGGREASWAFGITCKIVPIHYQVYYTIAGQTGKTSLGTFHLDDSTKLNSSKQPVMPFEPPRQNGKSFTGLYDSEGRQCYDSNGYPTDNIIYCLPLNSEASEIVLEARFAVNTYSVTLNANGGTFKDNNSTKILTGSAGEQISLEVPTRAGYIFKGYSWKGNCVGYDRGELSNFGRLNFPDELASDPFLSQNNNAANQHRLRQYVQGSYSSYSSYLQPIGATTPVGNYQINITTTAADNEKIGNWSNSAKGKAIGFVPENLSSAAKNVYYICFIASLPVGSHIEMYSGYMGQKTSNYKWLTTNQGKGCWAMYVVRAWGDATGKFETFGHTVFAPNSGTSLTYPYTASLAYYEVYNATKFKDDGKPATEYDTNGVPISSSYLGNGNFMGVGSPTKEINYTVGTGAAISSETFYALWQPSVNVEIHNYGSSTRTITLEQGMKIVTEGETNDEQYCVALPKNLNISTRKYVATGWKKTSNKQGFGIGDNYLGERVYSDCSLYAGWEPEWLRNEQSKPEGEGTAAEPYLISTPEHLMYFAQRTQVYGEIFTNIYCKQTCDLNFDGIAMVPIGNSSWYDASIGANKQVSFGCNYDGQGYNIENLYINETYEPFYVNSALFAFAERTEIKNLNIISGAIYGKRMVGGILGYGWRMTINNCTNSANIQAECIDESGPVIGVYAGGIAGYSCFGEIKNSQNFGNVFCASDGGGAVGGIVGGVDRPGNVEMGGTIEGCANFGNVEVKLAGSSVAYSNCSAGGIVGFGNAIIINNSSNIGNITSSLYWNGGIIGRVNVFTESEQNALKNRMEGCTNFGTVSGGQYIGGLAGTWGYGDIENCYAECTLDATETVGGLLGNLYDASKSHTIKNVAGKITLLKDARYTKAFSGDGSKWFALQNCCVIIKGVETIGDISDVMNNFAAINSSYAYRINTVNNERIKTMYVGNDVGKEFADFALWSKESLQSFFLDGYPIPRELLWFPVVDGDYPEGAISIYGYLVKSGFTRK